MEAQSLWNMTSPPEHPYQIQGNGGNRSPQEISEYQHWVVVGILMPIVIGLYLLLVLICYYLFCKKENNWEQELQNQLQHIQQNSASEVEMTPPPSYAILIGNGDSKLIPPSYKMLFPQASVDSSYTPELPTIGSEESDLIDLSTPNNTIRIFPNQIHIVCETPTSAIKFINKVTQSHVVGTSATTDSINTFSGPSTNFSRPIMSSRLQALGGSQYLFFPFAKAARIPSAREPMAPRSGSEDAMPTLDLELSRLEAGDLELAPPIFARSRMRRGSSF